jgi:chromosome segregation ATPase
MLGRTKEIERELIFCQAKVESLEEQLRAAHADKDELKQQVARLQESLFSIRAPEAYQDHKAKEYEQSLPPISEETRERNRIAKQVTTDYLNMLEGPTFRTGEDLDDLLAEGLLMNQKPVASIHGNNES